MHGKLRASPFAPQQQQVRDVHGRDQKHDGHGRHEREDRVARLAHDNVRERMNDWRQTSSRTWRRLLVQPAAESGQLGRRLRERDARPQPADQIDFAPRGVAERPARRHRMRRAPHLDAARIIDVGRQHSHNRETLFAERDPPADDVTCLRVAATPEAVADCHDRLRAIDIVVAVEHTSRDRVDAEHAEEVARHQSGVHFFYGAVSFFFYDFCGRHRWRRRRRRAPAVDSQRRLAQSHARRRDDERFQQGPSTSRPESPGLARESAADAEARRERART